MKKAPGGTGRLSLAKLILPACEPSLSSFPSLSSGLSSGLSAGPAPSLRETKGRQLPAFVSPLLAHEASAPTCVRCGAGLSWCAWMRDIQLLPIAQGKFYARCEACREKDATFKDDDGAFAA